MSIGEKSIAYYLNKSGLTVIESYKDREKLGKMEIDVFVPELNLGIEYDGRRYHEDPMRDYEKNRRCSLAGIKLLRFRELDCPSLVGVETIDIDSENYSSLSDGIQKMIEYIHKNYKINLEVDLDLNRDFHKIMEKKYLARKRKSLSEMYPEVAAMLHPDTAIKASAIPYMSNIPFDWVCPDCGYQWNAVVTSVVHSYKTFHYRMSQMCRKSV